MGPSVSVLPSFLILVRFIGSSPSTSLLQPYNYHKLVCRHFYLLDVDVCSCTYLECLYYLLFRTGYGEC